MKIPAQIWKKCNTVKIVIGYMETATCGLIDALGDYDVPDDGDY